MSDETGNGISVLHSVSGCYAEVHISWEIIAICMEKEQFARPRLHFVPLLLTEILILIYLLFFHSYSKRSMSSSTSGLPF